MTQLLALHEQLGVRHGVLVQAACYHSDHLLDTSSLLVGRRGNLYHDL